MKQLEPLGFGRIVVRSLTDQQGLADFIRRLVFIVASGNGDAHLKNWSVVYPDGMTAALSPAYDLVSTIQYLQDDELALNLAGSKRWDKVTIDSFRRLARKIGLDEAWMVERVRADVQVIMQAWGTSARELGYGKAALARIDAHHRTVPLFHDAGGG